jgi:hemoglobin
MTDLSDRADIEALLRRFYGRVLDDDVLAEAFTDVRASALQAHRHVHRRTPLSGQPFDRWLTTWTETVDEMYCGPVAEHAKIQASRIARAMNRRLTGNASPELDALARSASTTNPCRASSGELLNRQ